MYIDTSRATSFTRLAYIDLQPHYTCLLAHAQKTFFLGEILKIKGPGGGVEDNNNY